MVGVLQSTIGINAAPARRTRAGVVAAMAALGFSAAVTQLVLMRELLACFSGNELTLGVTLGCWLVLTAVGTAVGARIARRWASVPALTAGVIAVALVAIAEVLAIRGGRDLLFPRGAGADPVGTIIAGLLALAPFCLGSGALLTLGCRVLAGTGDCAGIGRVYSADATGSIAGAVVFTFVLSRLADHVAVLCWSAAVVCAAAAWISAAQGRRMLWAVALTGVPGLPATALLANLDARSAQWQHQGRIVHRASSPYGRLVVTRHAGQLTFFENGAPVIFTTNAVAVEELVHYALAQRPNARAVLLIGGGAAGAAREVLRYPGVREVTCIELDPAIMAASRRFLPENTADPRIKLVTGDGRRFVLRTGARYDAILIGLPDPTTFQLNRFFTVEFFAAAKRRLAPGGVVCFATGQYQNYVSPGLRQVIAAAQRTLASAFAHTLTLPGGRVFYLGSDGPLTRDIAGALERQRIEPRLVNRNYLDAMFTADRFADVNRAAAATAPVNRDFHPTLYYLRLRQWLAQFRFPAIGFAGALATMLVAGLFRLRAVPRMVFAAGFAGATLEIVMLVALQAFYGSVYQQVGLVVAAFMTGLAAGAALANQSLGAAPPAGVPPCSARGGSAVLQDETSPPEASPTGTSGSTPDSKRAAESGGARCPHHAVPVRAQFHVRHLALALAGIALVMAVGLPQLGRLSGPVGDLIGQAVILGATLILGAVMGAQFASAAMATSGAGERAAPVVFSADLVGAAVGAAMVSTLLLPLCGAGAVCGAAAGLNLLCVGLSLPRHRDA